MVKLLEVVGVGLVDGVDKRGSRIERVSNLKCCSLFLGSD